MKQLVICEKHIAARRIAYILSGGKARQGRMYGVPYYTFDDVTVVGLRGHIKKLDFPAEYARWNSSQPQQLIYVEPVKKVGEKHIANALKALARECSHVIIATDYDREGELIGAEILDLLPPDVTVKRARFSAITAPEITQAFKQVEEVNHNLARSAEARQYIDLIWGASLTRFISLASHQLGKSFLSVGRVQSPTLALIVNREKEIQEFTPTPFWKLSIVFEKDGITFAGEYPEKIQDEEKAKELYEKVKEADAGTVTTYEKHLRQSMPPPPFDTTTFLKEAAARGFSATQAMKIAEELYMNGLISYPRTDNTVYPALPFKNILKKLESVYPEEVALVFSMLRGKPVSGKKVSKDHPPIHPVGAAKLTGAHAKIYDLIVRRFMATLSKNAVLEEKKAEVRVAGEPFMVKGLIIKEENWRRVYPTRLSEKTVPDLEQGEQLPIVQRKKVKDTTKPPKRYTQGSLIVEMEKLGLGTKSTRHEIIGKLLSRHYIRGKQLIPTPTAFAVIEALEEGAPIITKPDMTAHLEEEMDRIAEGTKTFEEVLEESRQILSRAFEILEKNRHHIGKRIQEAIARQNHFGTCPKCGKEMVLRKSARGKRFIGCSNYPKCTNSYPLPQKNSVFFEGEQCPKCGAPMVVTFYKGRKQKRCANMNCS